MAIALTQWVTLTGSSQTYIRRNGAVCRVAALVAMIHLLLNLHLVHHLAVRIVHMHRTCEARVERMDRSDDLDRLVLFGDGCSDQSLLVRGTLSFSVTRARVPC